MRKIINQDFLQGQGNPPSCQRFATSTTRQASFWTTNLWHSVGFPCHSRGRFLYFMSIALLELGLKSPMQSTMINTAWGITNKQCLVLQRLAWSWDVILNTKCMCKIIFLAKLYIGKIRHFSQRYMINVTRFAFFLILTCLHKKNQSFSLVLSFESISIDELGLIAP